MTSIPARVYEYLRTDSLGSVIKETFKSVSKTVQYSRDYGIKAVLQRLAQRIFQVNSPRQSASNLQEMLDDHFAVAGSMRVFQVPGAGRRLNILIDGMSNHSLYGGVSTAIIFSVLLAEKWDCELRVITLAEPALKRNFQRILELNQIRSNKNIDFVFLDQANPKAELPVRDQDVFLTTSWWSTSKVLDAIGASRIIYLLQEDERAFYPYGDYHLRCSNVLKNQNIQFVINSKLLYDHFVLDGFDNMRARALWFEPARLGNLFFPEEHEKELKRNFFFYARPNHPRNLFYLGLEVIDTAVSSGRLDPNQWQFYFVGRDLPAKLKIATPAGLKLVQNVSLSEYAALVRKMDLGLCLMYTPHPSYPALDLAASGAVVVTNKFGTKQNLDKYSKNILCQEPNVDSLLKGIETGVKLSADRDARTGNFQNNGILRDWKLSFEEVLSHLEGWPASVSL